MPRNTLDLSLYLVTDSNAEDLLCIIRQSVEGGVTVVQLREKNAPDRFIATMGQKILSLLRPLGIPLIINNRVDIAHAISADGVHLGQSDLSVSAARAILGSRAIVGISVETIEQAMIAQEEEIDYLAVSPLFQTPSKVDCSAPWGFEGLEKACQLSRHPVIAIGGINEENVERVIAKGAAGVAIVSAIFCSSSPRSAAMELKKRIKRATSCIQ